MKSKNVYWGLFFIVMALLIILNQMGVLGGINSFSLIISILMIPVIISSIKHTNFWGILFPLAIVAILYSKELGIETLTPWPILGVALFLSLGLSFIVPPKPYVFPNHHHQFEENIEDHPEEGVVNISAKLAASIKYIDVENLKRVNVYCSCAGSKIYFDHAKMQGNQITVNMDIHCSGVELYIPKTWTVEDQMTCVMGGIEEKGRKEISAEGKKIMLTGKSNLSGISIIYC